MIKKTKKNGIINITAIEIKESPNLIIGAVAAGVTLITSGVSVIYSTSLDKWKEDKFESWKNSTHFYVELEDRLSCLSEYQKQKGNEVVTLLIKRFFDAPNKKTAMKSLNKVRVFVDTLTNAETDSARAATIAEYLAKYSTTDKVNTQKYSFMIKVDEYKRF